MRIGTNPQSQPSGLDLFPSSHRSRLCPPSHFCTPMVMMIDKLPYKRASCSSPPLREWLNQPHQLHCYVVSFCCISLHFWPGATTTSWFSPSFPVLFNPEKLKLSGASLSRSPEVSDFPVLPNFIPRCRASSSNTSVEQLQDYQRCQRPILLRTLELQHPAPLTSTLTFKSSSNTCSSCFLSAEPYWGHQTYTSPKTDYPV